MHMSNIDRRQFLTATAQTAAAAAASSAMPAAIARALEIPAHHQTGTIKDVQHVVILTLVRPLLRQAARRARLR
jgi:phospholipase C